MMNPDALFDALNDAGVDYVVVGGFAAMIRGSERITKDLDLVYHGRRANLEKLCKVVNALEPQLMVLGRPEGRSVDVTPEMLKRYPTLQLMTNVGPLDLLSNIDGFQSYGALKSASNVITVDDTRAIPVLTREAVLKSKRALKRPKDVEDIKQLEALAEIEAVDAAGQADSTN